MLDAHTVNATKVNMAHHSQLSGGFSISVSATRSVHDNSATPANRYKESCRIWPSGVRSTCVHHRASAIRATSKLAMTTTLVPVMRQA